MSVLTQAEFTYYVNNIWKPGNINEQYYYDPNLITATQRACECLSDRDPTVWDIVYELQRDLKLSEENPNAIRAILYDRLTTTDDSNGVLSLTGTENKRLRQLDTIPTGICRDANQVCVLCQDSIQVDADIYCLIQCNHKFHAIEHECLGQHQGIISWLIQHGTCPLCRATVLG